MSIGEYRVGVTFNPSQDARVDLIKRAAAHFIDQLDSCLARPKEGEPEPNGQLAAEQGRLLRHAMQLAEDAAMNGVKAVTKRPYAEA